MNQLNVIYFMYPPVVWFDWKIATTNLG